MHIPPWVYLTVCLSHTLGIPNSVPFSHPEQGGIYTVIHPIYRLEEGIYTVTHPKTGTPRCPMRYLTRFTVGQLLGPVGGKEALRTVTFLTKRGRFRRFYAVLTRK